MAIYTHYVNDSALAEAQGREEELEEEEESVGPIIDDAAEAELDAKLPDCFDEVEPKKNAIYLLE